MSIRYHPRRIPTPLWYHPRRIPTPLWVVVSPTTYAHTVMVSTPHRYGITSPSHDVSNVYVVRIGNTTWVYVVGIGNNTMWVYVVGMHRQYDVSIVPTTITHTPTTYRFYPQLVLIYPWRINCTHNYNSYIHNVSFVPTTGTHIPMTYQLYPQLVLMYPQRIDCTHDWYLHIHNI